LASPSWKGESKRTIETYIRKILGNVRISRIHTDERGYAIITFGDHAQAVDAYFLFTEKVSDDIIVNFNRGKKKIDKR
jgi:hypothetical protein